MPSARRSIAILALSGLAAILLAPGAGRVAAEPPRHTPRDVPLAAPLDTPEAEVSALAWYIESGRRWLALLPEDGFAPGKQRIGHALYLMARSDLLRAERAPGAFTPPLERVPIVYALDPASRAAFGRIEGHDGYEALIFAGRTAYLCVEHDHTSGSGWLLRGRLDGRVGQRRLLITTARLLPPPAGWNAAKTRNKSYESLILSPDGIVAIWECNGVTSVWPQARAIELPRDFEADTPLGWRALPSIPYRITDAAGIDPRTQSFWVSSYYFAPQPEGCDAHKDVAPALRAAWEADAQANSGGRFEHIERLIELRLSDAGIERTATPPIWLELLEAPRNWEGLVGLRAGSRRGFVLATDKYPGSLAVVWR